MHLRSDSLKNGKSKWGLNRSLSFGSIFKLTCLVDYLNHPLYLVVQANRVRIQIQLFKPLFS